MIERRVAFHTTLRVPVGGVTERHGWFLKGAAGWGEFSPLPSWSGDEQRAAAAAAEEAATLEFPAPVRDRVAINALVPRIDPDAAALMAKESGCRTIKIKVGDFASLDRIAAVRKAIGPSGRIRLDANGSWDVDDAVAELKVMAVYDIELCEDPVATMEELAELRKLSPIPIAAENCVRTVADAARLAEMNAADALVIKPQRIGGIRAALSAAEAAGIPIIASCALETSVGLAAVLAFAAALGDMPFDCGIGTANLLSRDFVTEPLIPRDGFLIPCRPEIDEESLR